MNVSYRQAASDDVVRQFRYYLVTLGLPEIALRFRSSVRLTVQLLRHRPYLGSRYALDNPHYQNLRFWPVAGFAASWIYYTADSDTVRVVRILHGKRDVRRILERERPDRP